MKTVLIALAVLVPALAAAEDPKPFVLRNGRAAPSSDSPAAPPAAPAATGGAAGGQFINAAALTSTFGSNAVHPTVTGGDPAATAASVIAAATSGGGSGQALRGVRSPSARRGVTRRAGRSRKASGDTVPPNYTKPGALIRSEGQLPQYSDPGNAGTHSVDGGGFIAQDPKRSRDLGASGGVTWGKPDTPPGGNANGSGSRAGGNGVTANGPEITVTDNSHSNNVNGNQNAGGGNDNGNGNGNGNGKGNNGGSSFDPSF
jgi:hypothetical protein